MLAAGKSYNLTLAESKTLVFAHNGSEPNKEGAIKPSYSITVTDSGGGEEGVSSSTSGKVDVVLNITPNNDDPIFNYGNGGIGSVDNPLQLPESVTNPGSIVNLQDYLKATDDDIGTSNQNLVYTLTGIPANAEIQYFVGGDVGYDHDGDGVGDGWVTLGNGARFTQADIDSGKVRIMQTGPADNTVKDSFSFQVRDSAYGLPVDADGAIIPGGAPQEGAVRNPDGTIKNIVFNFEVIPDSDPDAPNTHPDGPHDPTPGYGTGSGNSNTTTTDNGTSTTVTEGNKTWTNKIEATVTDPGNKATDTSIVWNEDNVGADGGYEIDETMLGYEITRSLDDGTQTIEMKVPPTEVVYTMLETPGNGSIQKRVDGEWVTVSTLDQFTQDDINEGRIRFVSNGSEVHDSSFKFAVSDGTNLSFTSDFTIDITPTNDRPTAGGGSATVVEGAGNTTYLGSDALSMSDADGSATPEKAVTGEGVKDPLWFQITSLPAEGKLEYYDSVAKAWVEVTSDKLGNWYSQDLLTSGGEGGEGSGLRYTHNGTEPLTYAGGPKVSFEYQVRDDLSAATSSNEIRTDAAPTDKTPQGNLSDLGTVTIHVTPVNNAPAIKTDPDSIKVPSISGSIDGEHTTAVNEILTIFEGGSGKIDKNYLVAIDSDNSTLQRQYQLTSVPKEGTLTLRGKPLGVGSTFTQADIDKGDLKYEHSGDEPGTRAEGVKYDDSFQFIVSDGDQNSDTGTFWIVVNPLNDKPEVTNTPSGPVIIDSTNPEHNKVPGFVIKDVDLTDSVISGEKDLITVIVRVTDDSGKPANVPGGYTLEVETSANVSGDPSSSSYLQLTGSVADINKALASLKVGFGGDPNGKFKLEVIVDDRLNANQTGYQNGPGASANGGPQNQDPTTGATSPVNVDQIAYNWGTALAPTDSLNISSKSVELWVSTSNEVPTVKAPPALTVDEDVPQKVEGIKVSDAESEAFGTKISVTLSVNSGSLALKDLPGTITSSGSGTSITLSGTAKDINDYLQSSGDDTGVFYTSAKDVNHDVNGTGKDGDVTLTVTVNEGTYASGGSAIGGDTGSGSVANDPVSTEIAIIITAVNDAPTIVAPTAPVAVDSSNWTDLGQFTIADVDSNDGYADGENDGTIQVTIRLGKDGVPLNEQAYKDLGIALQGTGSAGSLQITNSIGDLGTGAAGGPLVIRGTLAEIQAYLSNLQVKFANADQSNADAKYQVEVIVDDRLRDPTSGVLLGSANGGGHNQNGTNTPSDISPQDNFNVYSSQVSGYGIYNVVSASRDIFVSSINDPAEIGFTSGQTGLSSQETAGSSTVTLDGLKITDSDAQDKELTVTVQLPEGFKFIEGGDSISTDGKTITFKGTLDQINAQFAKMKVQLPDVAGDALAEDWNGSFTFTVTVNDHGNTGITSGTAPDPKNGNSFNVIQEDGKNVLTSTRDITFVVAPRNDAPVVKPGAGGTTEAKLDDIAEDPTLSTNDSDGKTVEDLFGGFFDDSRDGIAGNQVAGGTGGTSPDNFYGVAIVQNAATEAQGKWQYFDETSDTWKDIPAGDQKSAALVLEKDVKLRFAPSKDWNGTLGADRDTFVTSAKGPADPAAVPVDPTTGAVTLTGQYGTLTIDANGNYTYTRFDGSPLNATEVFDYTITDQDGDSSPATITITIADNTPSVTDKDGNPPTLETDPSDPDGPKRPVIKPDGSVSEGGLPDGSDPDKSTSTTTGTIVLTPGDETTTVTVTPPGGNPVTLVPGVNPPIKTPQGEVTFTYTEGDPSTGTPPTITYEYELKTPVDDSSKSPTDEFNVTITDKDGDSTTVTVVVDITDDVPVAKPDSATVDNGSNTASGNALGNDTLGADRDTFVTSAKGPHDSAPVTVDPDTGKITVTGQYGTLTISPDGSYVYTRTDGSPLNATEVFDYTITDKDGDPSSATITITIADKAPTLNPPSTSGSTPGNPSVDESGLNGGSDPDSGSNKTTGTFEVDSPDGGTSTITVTPPGGTPQEVKPGVPTVVDTPHGQVTVIYTPGDGTTPPTVTYEYELKTPTNGSGATPPTDSFTITVTDSDGDSTSTTVTVDIVDDRPDAQDDNNTTLVNVPVTGQLGGNDQPGADGIESWTLGDPPKHGTVTIDPTTGQYIFTPAPGFVGTDTFTYTVTDKDGSTDTATVTITVTNRPPVAVDDSNVTAPGEPAKGNVITGGSSGDHADSDPDGQPVTVTEITVDGITVSVPPNDSVKVSIPNKGVLEIHSDGSYTFTAQPLWGGQVPDIHYTISDGAGGTSTAVLRITANAAPLNVDPPARPNTGITTDVGTTVAPPLSGGSSTLLVLGDAMIDTPSVFWESYRYFQDMRVPTVMHPITYVNLEVQRAQLEAVQAMLDSWPSLNESTLRSISLGLGQDPNLFVEHAVRAVQQERKFWEFLARELKGNLPTESPSQAMLFKPSEELNKAEGAADTAAETNSQPNDDQDPAQPQALTDLFERWSNAQAQPADTGMMSAVMAGKSASFSEQLKQSAHKLPSYLG